MITVADLIEYLSDSLQDTPVYLNTTEYEDDNAENGFILEYVLEDIRRFM